MVLAQSAPAATTATSIYTAPTGKIASIDTLLVCNRGAASSYRVYLTYNPSSIQTKEYIYYDTPILANDTFTAEISITISGAITVGIYSTSGNISFTLLGEEINASK